MNLKGVLGGHFPLGAVKCIHRNIWYFMFINLLEITLCPHPPEVYRYAEYGMGLIPHFWGEKKHFIKILFYKIFTVSTKIAQYSKCSASWFHKLKYKIISQRFYAVTTGITYRRKSNLKYSCITRTPFLTFK